MSTTSLHTNNLCHIDEFYSKQGLKYMLKKSFMIGKGANMDNIEDVTNLLRIYNYHDCFLEIEKNKILELINKKINDL